MIPAMYLANLKPRPAKTPGAQPKKFSAIITETMRYEIVVEAKNASDAREQAIDLWHEQMQLFRPISDGGIEQIHIEPVGGDR